MTTWEIHITYGSKPFKLQAQVEYHTNQVMRIRVRGSKSSLLLENNYPMLRSSNSKKGIQWKLREGTIKESNTENSRLLLHIMEQLEYHIKKEFP